MSILARESHSKYLTGVSYPIRRELPARGKVSVKVGDRVRAGQTIGECLVPGERNSFQISTVLGTSAWRIPRYMVKQIGDSIRANEEIAVRSSWGRKRSFRSPIDGTLKAVDPDSGKVTIQRGSVDYSLEAGFQGTVERVAEDRVIDIAVTATLLQGVMGIGLPVMGSVEIVTSDNELLKARHIDGGCCDHILVSPGRIDYELLKRCMAMGVRGVVAGSISARDFQEYVNRECDGDVSGPKSKAIGLLLTEGFGDFRMRQPFWEFLRSLGGSLVLLDWLVSGKPALVYPTEHTQLSFARDHDPAQTFVPLRPRQRVRIIAGLQFGQEGTVVSEQLTEKPEVYGPGVELIQIRLGDGKTVFLPRWNIEATQS